MNDIRHTEEYSAIAEHLRRLHEPAFGRPSAIFDPQIAPDATQVLVTGTVLAALDGMPRLRLFTAQDGELRAVADGEGSSRGGRFSPDGKTVALLSDQAKEGEFQLCLTGAETPDALIAAPHVPGSVEFLHWSPDGRSVLLGVADLGADVAGHQNSGVNLDAGSDLPSWHPEVEIGTPDSAWRTLWTYELDSGELAQVSPAGVNCWEASWCGTDQVLAITSSLPSEDAWYGAVLSIIDVDSQTHRELLASDVQLGLPTGSPDGRYAGVVQAVCSDRGIIAGDLIVLDLVAGTRTTVDTAHTDVTAVQWSADHLLGYAGLRGLDTVAGRYDAATQLAEEIYCSPLAGGPRYPEASFARTGEIALVQNSYRLPHQVVVVADDEVTVRASVRHAGSEYLLTLAGEAEPTTWTAPDGLTIEGVLCRPQGAGPFPLVINIHGGPIWAFQNSWSMLYQWVPLLVSRGYAVLSPNPRGSGGRGQDFAGRVAGDMGGLDTYDFLSGIDALVQRGIVDPARVGLIGGSYGGFMASWLVTQDQRFAASVPISPVTDWYSQSFTSNIAAWGNAFLGADPELPGSKAHTRSPVLQASKVRTPCLNVAGANDRCTPPAQAREFHQALTAQGVESVLVVYPEEGHGVRAYPAMTDFLTRVMAWFDRHMPARRGPA
ncbi:prolyl oligopeptidase family serine peptidase [Kribbella sp. DT2]|uniref:alpha/beta hydrolase family protein n=1 Tax=Kribbella sp. DT2 TaxID=3393427 RepID=UPI003CEE9073